MITVFDLFRTKNSKFKQLVASAIRALVVIDEKYKSLDEGKNKKLIKYLERFKK